MLGYSRTVGSPSALSVLPFPNDDRVSTAVLQRWRWRRWWLSLAAHVHLCALSAIYVSQRIFSLSRLKPQSSLFSSLYTPFLLLRRFSISPSPPPPPPPPPRSHTYAAAAQVALPDRGNIFFSPTPPLASGGPQLNRPLSLSRLSLYTTILVPLSRARKRAIYTPYIYALSVCSRFCVRTIIVSRAAISNSILFSIGKSFFEVVLMYTADVSLLCTCAYKEPARHYFIRYYI